MARGSFNLEVPGDALATVTITMSVRDWQLALTQFSNGGDFPYEANQVLAVIRDAVRHASTAIHILKEDERNG